MKTKFVSIIAISFFLMACQSTNPPKTDTNQAKSTNTEQTKPSPSATVAAETNTNSADKPVQPIVGKKITAEEKTVFTADRLPKGWDYIDSEEDTAFDLKKEPGFLILNVKTNRDFRDPNLTAPRLMKGVHGDFEIETKVIFDPKQSYQGAGLLVWNNISNYLRLERGFGGIDGGESGVRFDRASKETGYISLSGTSKNATTETETDLKIRRVGNDFTAFYRVKGGDWKEVSKVTLAYNESVDIGLIACNTASEITAKFGSITVRPPK